MIPPASCEPKRRVVTRAALQGTNDADTVAWNSGLAAGILQVLYERGLNVPSDISVIGYDDSMAQFLSPALSSIAQPYLAIGDSVMAYVEEAVGQDTSSAKTRERSVSTSLVLRDSIGPVPGSS
ncbi:hypothetical protein GFM14_24540 [Rhizobium leguminosarum bv. viciae]|nr:hypothetical protein [Rhizobium leguminosarum bv. viciae]NKK87506.1 hypothetical protein [Rhizobium leguminosarum bv. viciae]